MNLCHAAYSGNLERVKFWFEQNPQDIDKPSDVVRREDDELTPECEMEWTPLFWAISGGGHFEVCEYLIKKGANKDLFDDCGRQSIHWATNRGYLDIVKLLIENGVDIETKDSDLWTPLHWATYNSHFNVILYLLEMNADIEAKDVNLETPLFYAASLRSYEDGEKILNFFVNEKKVNLNVVNDSLWTPMHNAAIAGPKNVEILIKAGLRWDTKTIDGLTPKDMAKQFENFDSLAYLESLEKSKL